MKIKTVCFLACAIGCNNLISSNNDLAIDIESIIDNDELQLNLDKYILKILHKDANNKGVGYSSLKSFLSTDPIKMDNIKIAAKQDNQINTNTSNNSEQSKQNLQNITEPIISNVNQSDIIYLDYQGAAPCYDVEVRRLFIDTLRYPGNPSAISKRGRFLDKAYKHSQKIFANLINASEEEIIFTSGATESNNIAILGYVRNLPKDSHIITTAIEHSSVLNTFKALKNDGYDVTILKVNKDGIVDIESFKKSISPKTKFVSIMYVNNEIGTIQNIKEIGEICKEKGIIFHTDASQAFGKLKIDVKELKIDMLSASGQKVYAVPGVGLLYVSKALKSQLKPIMYGGDQQYGIRPGTIPVALIIAFAKASEITYKNLAATNARLEKLQTKINNAMVSLNNELGDIDGKHLIELNGSSVNRILGNLNYSIRGVDPEDLLKYLDDEFAVSFGSACESGNRSSHVIVAIDKDLEKSPTNLRIGFGRFTSKKSVEKFIDRLTHAIKYLRTKYPDKGQRSCEVSDKVSI